MLSDVTGAQRLYHFHRMVSPPRKLSLGRGVIYLRIDYFWPVLRGPNSRSSRAQLGGDDVNAPQHLSCNLDGCLQVADLISRTSGLVRIIVKSDNIPVRSLHSYETSRSVQTDRRSPYKRIRPHCRQHKS
jgi:hypothetical protein